MAEGLVPARGTPTPGTRKGASTFSSVPLADTKGEIGSFVQTIHLLLCGNVLVPLAGTRD